VISEVPTATGMKLAVRWDVAPCNLEDTDQPTKKLNASITTLMMEAVSSLKRWNLPPHGVTSQNTNTKTDNDSNTTVVCNFIYNYRIPA
jgi:hypothetical protein